MKKLALSLVLCLLQASAVLAQNSPAVDELLHRLEQIGIDAKGLQNPPTPEPQLAPVVLVPQGGSIQDAVNKATVPGTIIALVPGGLYKESVIVPKPNVGLIITTQGYELLDRAIQPTDAPRTATLQGAAGQSFGLWIMASGTQVQGLTFGPNASGQGDMLRVGDSASTVLEDVPDGVIVRQNYFRGDPGTVFGQKRAIAANGSHLLITQNYAENIWIPGQDSQCVAVFSTPGPVTITWNILGCASENVLIGGVPPAAPAFLPSDVLTEWNVLYKPLAWKGAKPSRIVKNLYEVKVGRRIMARHNWMQNNWQGEQPGPAVVLTMATNGACGWCVMEDIGFEGNVVWNVAAGFTLTGYQYSFAPGAGAGVRFGLKNNLFYINKAGMGGNGWPLLLQNEPKDVLVDHNTFIHDSSSAVYAQYGAKWPLQDPSLLGSVPAGPVQGFVFTNNLLAHGSYGIFTPEGNSGNNLATYFPGAVIRGNVFGGAPAAAIAKYNVFSAVTPTNVSQPMVDFNAQVNITKCPMSTFNDVSSGAGADCSKLPWALKDLVPASAR